MPALGMTQMFAAGFSENALGIHAGAVALWGRRNPSPNPLGCRGARPGTSTLIEVADMKAEYDFSKMKSRSNPYASKLKKPVTIRLSEDVVDYFKAMASEAGVPYQSLINLYLRDCLAQNRRVQIKWPSAA